MPGWAFSLLIGAFVGLIVAALVFECIGERRAGGKFRAGPPYAPVPARREDPEPPAA